MTLVDSLIFVSGLILGGIVTFALLLVIDWLSREFHIWRYYRKGTFKA